MLQLKNITITHKKDLRTIIQDFSFVLHEGDKAAIIGEEGNGKSTLLKLIYQEELIRDYAEYSGEIIKNKKRLGYLSQELSPEQKQKTVLAFCEEVSCFYEITPKELSNIALELQLDVSLFFSEQKVEELSGGEKVKLQLARILMDRPDILLLDEPSNDVDIETLQWLETFICKSKLPILYISHDEMLLENTANVIIHLEQVRRKTISKVTIQKIGYLEYVNQRMQMMNHQEQVAKKERSDYDKKMDKYRQIQQKIEHQQNTISRGDPHGGRLLKKKMHSVVAMGKRFEKEREGMTEIPDTEDAIFVKFGEQIRMPHGKNVLEFSLDELKVKDRVLVSNIQLQVRGPEKVCIIGKNGVGKTTLMKLIVEKLLSRTDIKVSYMPQNYEDLLAMNLTPIEYLMNTGDKEEQVRIRTYLGSMKYTADEMNHAILELSGGQKAKLLFLKMSMDGSNVLLLDEPTRNFSPLSNPVIRELLKEYQGTIISISHDRKYIKEVSTVVYTLTKEGFVKTFYETYNL